jgi:hypothetical protein
LVTLVLVRVKAASARFLYHFVHSNAHNQGLLAHTIPLFLRLLHEAEVEEADAAEELKVQSSAAAHFAREAAAEELDLHHPVHGSGARRHEHHHHDEGARLAILRATNNKAAHALAARAGAATYRASCRMLTAALEQLLLALVRDNAHVCSGLSDAVLTDIAALFKHRVEAGKLRRAALFLKFFAQTFVQGGRPVLRMQERVMASVLTPEVSESCFRPFLQMLEDRGVRGFARTAASPPASPRHPGQEVPNGPTGGIPGGGPESKHVSFGPGVTEAAASGVSPSIDDDDDYDVGNDDYGYDYETRVRAATAQRRASITAVEVTATEVETVRYQAAVVRFMAALCTGHSTACETKCQAALPLKVSLWVLNTSFSEIGTAAEQQQHQQQQHQHQHRGGGGKGVAGVAALVNVPRYLLVET